MNIYSNRKKPDILYYGSSELLDLLIPSQDYYKDSKKHPQKVVYATSIRDIALAYALGAVPDETGKTDRVMSHKHNGEVKMIYHKGHPKFRGTGYVYRLSSEGFVHAGGTQWVNHKPVTPLDIIQMNVDDYLYLFRYATEEEKREVEEDFSEM